MEIFVDEELRYSRFRATFDFESLLKVLRKEHSTFIHHHIPYSVGISSNVPGFESTVILNENPLELVREFVHVLVKISKKAYSILSPLYADVFKKLDEKISTCESRNRKIEANRIKKVKRSLLLFLKQLITVGFNSSRFDIPMIMSYLTTVLREMGNYKFPKTDRYKNTEAPVVTAMNTVYKGTQVLCFTTDYFKLLDVCCFAAPGMTYEQYVKTWRPPNTTISKLKFPHELMTEFGKLENTTFPSFEDFHSNLKGKNAFSSIEEYEEHKREWVGDDGIHFKNGGSLRDYLIEYQRADVEPFLICLNQHVKLYKDELKLDLLAFNVTLASLSWRWAFIDEPSVFYCFTKEHSVVHDEILRGRTGGLVIIFKRETFVGDTITPRGTYTSTEKVKKIIVIDANALYPNVFQRPQLTGPPVFRRAPHFTREEINHGVPCASEESYEWLQYVKRTQNIKISTKFDHGEVKVTDRNYSVDGYAKPTKHHRKGVCYEYHGCRHHGHVCYLNDLESKARAEEKNKNIPYDVALKKFREIAEKDRKVTLEKDQYIRKHMPLIIMRSCEWYRMKKENKEVREILQQAGCSLYPKSFKAPSSATQEEIINGIINGTVFGLVRCDVNIPNNIRHKFELFPPIYFNTSISRDDVGDYTKKLAEELEELKTPRRQLVTGFSARDTIITTNLAQWYLEKGIEVDNVRWVLEYTPGIAIASKVDRATDIRRRADVDDTWKTLAMSFKLHVNAIYGKSGERQDKKIRSMDVREKNVHKYLAKPNFKHITPILPPHMAPEVGGSGEYAADEIYDDEVEGEELLYRVEMSPHRITNALPVQMSFWVLCESKLKMLRMIYDVLQFYLKNDCFSIVYSDTDSLAIELAADSFDDIVKDGMEKEYFEERHNFFPTEACDNCRPEYVRCREAKNEWPMERECCKDAHREALRTPGLFTVEATATDAIFLAPKTYCMVDESTGTKKISTKGLNKNLNSYEMETFRRVLRTRSKAEGVNKGMKRLKSGSVVGYEQRKSGLTPLYIKRKVMNDGVETRVLDICK